MIFRAEEGEEREGLKGVCVWDTHTHTSCLLLICFQNSHAFVFGLRLPVV